MDNIKEFRRVNGLTQTDVARYLSDTMGKAFISQIEKGERALPAIHLAKLLQNDKGWDVSMLTGNTPTVSVHTSGHGQSDVNVNSHNNYNSAEIEHLKEQIENLKQLLEEEKKRSTDYWNTIQTLIRK